MSARSTQHPFTNALYELRPDGNVSVVDGAKQGVFHPDGRWISGALRTADPQLCVWITNNPQTEAQSDSHLTAAAKQV